MVTTPRNARPRSPHLSVWKWGPHMAVSIFHRVTGDGMAIVGTLLFVGFLAALAGGKESYDAYIGLFTLESGKLNPWGYLFGIGLTLAFFQHMASGIRHLVLDTGAAYELKVNKASAQATFFFAIVATTAYWAFLLAGK